jgi:hypothetical protein
VPDEALDSRLAGLRSKIQTSYCTSTLTEASAANV